MSNKKLDKAKVWVKMLNTAFIYYKFIFLQTFPL